MREGIAFVAFTDRGRGLAESLCAALGGSLSFAREENFSLPLWTARAFADREALVFVSAAGIAVRAVAPHLKSKAEDPAVLCLDEAGQFVIPLVSGHLGGANALARRLAAITGGTAVITTATDVNAAFAVDLWAKRQGMAVLQPERIKGVSSKILAGETVTVSCPWPVAGEAPAHVALRENGDVLVDVRPRETGALQLAPRVLSLGIGCKRGTEASKIEEVFARFCAERGILPQAIRAAATIDRKADEAGLLRFCEKHGWPLRFYSAEELAAAPGRFSASAFVENTVGVDNVCERAAVLVSGGALLEKKYALDGVTLAIAVTKPALDWSYCDG